MQITFFGQKSGQDLKNRAAHPHQEFPGVPPSPGFRTRTRLIILQVVASSGMLMSFTHNSMRSCMKRRPFSFFTRSRPYFVVKRGSPRKFGAFIFSFSCLAFKRKHQALLYWSFMVNFDPLGSHGSSSCNTMATDSAETLPSESIQQQILVSEQVTAAEGFQNAISSNIPTTIQTIPQQNGEIATISTSTLAETMATSEAIMATESISVGTQEASSSLSAQEIVDSIPQVQEHDSVPGSQQSLVISAENVAIGTSASLDASPHPQIASNYPWAARLHDCELIGDSYRGYVMNEVELDLILTLHKQHTSSCWGTRQSPSSAKPSIRLMWKSQYVPYDGIPFLNTGAQFFLFMLGQETELWIMRPFWWGGGLNDPCTPTHVFVLTATFVVSRCVVCKFWVLLFR